MEVAAEKLVELVAQFADLARRVRNLEEKPPALRACTRRTPCCGAAGGDQGATFLCCAYATNAPDSLLAAAPSVQDVCALEGTLQQVMASDSIQQPLHSIDHAERGGEDAICWFLGFLWQTGETETLMHVDYSNKFRIFHYSREEIREVQSYMQLSRHINFLFFWK
jgi:hypothetical protein